MEITEEQRWGLGIALNEANLLRIEVDPNRSIGAATFAVLTLPEEGPMPEDSRVQFRFHSVERVAARLLESTPGIKPFSIEQLLPVMQSFGGGCIYGWEFIDISGADTHEWLEQLSLDWRSANLQVGEVLSHSISLSQEGYQRSLDICIWFGALEIFDPTGKQISLDDFIAGGKRWWDAFFTKDNRTEGVGLFPL